MIKRYKHNKEKRNVRTKARIKSGNRTMRLSVNRTNKFVYAQLIDMTSGKTLIGVVKKNPEEAGKAIAGEAKKMKISKVVFDRGPYKYHGRVKLLADAARSAGLEF